MKVVVNGRTLQFSGSRIEYEDIAILAGQPNGRPTVTLAFPNGHGQTLLPGQSAALVEGVVISAVDTNNA